MLQPKAELKDHGSFLLCLLQSSRPYATSWRAIRPQQEVVRAKGWIQKPQFLVSLSSHMGNIPKYEFTWMKSLNDNIYKERERNER